MSRRVVIFQPVSSDSPWPPRLSARFRRHISRFGTAHFPARSPQLERFEAALRKRGARAARYEVIVPRRDELSQYEFHFLTLDSDRGYEKGDLWDSSTACPGDGRFHCGVGATQVRRPVIDASRSKHLDLMTDFGWPRPFVYLVSRRMALLLADSGLSGFRLAPCLGAGREYENDESLLDHVSAEQWDQATHFQLLVTGRAPGSAWVGEVLHAFAECTECGTLHGAIFESLPRPARQDLDHDLDFQLLWRLRSTNRGVFGIRGEHLLVSARAIDFLLRHEVTGLHPFLTDPFVRFGVVDWQE